MSIRPRNKASRVEIDTFWNVKLDIIACLIRQDLVEIDTFWNVKSTSSRSGFSLACRNRYILECKVIWSRSLWAKITVEIDTFWNVKTYEILKELKYEIRRNRYILECKGQRVRKLLLQLQVEIDTFWNVKNDTHSLLHIFKHGRNRYILECKDESGSGVW